MKLQHFFSKIENEDFIVLKDEEKNHIVKSLRMKVGEDLIVCDGNLNDYVCKIEKIEREIVVLKVLRKEKNVSEPTVDLHLFQAVPKFLKFDLIVQKSVELGVKSITPIMTKRCVAKIDEKNCEKKLERFKKIAKNAAEQSRRGVIPVVNNVLTFKEAVKKMQDKEIKILFYEYGNVKLNNINLEEKKNIGILIGGEGGFDKEEIDFAKKQGLIIGSLGSRILRCETASICAVSVLMHITGNL